MNTWGRLLKLSIFGESHGEAIGIIIDGLPVGEEISTVCIKKEMARRAPGGQLWATSRKEGDEVKILSGLYEGRISGAPLCGLILNSDVRSRDYNDIFRPGHADWAARQKYGPHVDLRGGGHFSGRLTAPLVFAGAVAKQILSRKGISVYGRIAALGSLEDRKVEEKLELRQEIAAKLFPVADEAIGESMKAEISQAKNEGDSLGGIIELAAFGLPGGLGEPFFASFESAAASLLFSIPAVKGVEFGEGFNFSKLRGSLANDELCLGDGTVKAVTNHNGGVLGGITNGEPLIARLAIKPTPSIALKQRSVNPATMEECDLKIKGRHDPAIVPRAVVVAEAALALCILDFALILWGRPALGLGVM